MDSSDHIHVQRLHVSESPSALRAPESEELLPSDADEHDARNGGDTIIQSQLAILEHIQRANELRRKTNAVPKDLSRCVSAPVAVVNVPFPHLKERTADDSDLLRAQERLLERFRKQKEERELQQQANDRDAKKAVLLKVSRSSREIVKPCEPFLPTRAHTDPIVPSSSPLLRYESDTVINCPDHCARLGKKKFIVRGTDHTYEAIQSGSSSIVDCVACGQALQVPATAKAVYCTCCHHISSIGSK